MRNTHGVWILYSMVLILKFLIAEKQRTVAERHRIKRDADADKTYKSKYFKNAFTLK